MSRSGPFRYLVRERVRALRTRKLLGRSDVGNAQRVKKCYRVSQVLSSACVL